MTHFLVLALNRHGVLARITGIVSALGANIETARAAAIADSELSVIDIHASVSQIERDRMVRKIARLVDVVAVQAGQSGEDVFVEFRTPLWFNASDRKET